MDGIVGMTFEDHPSSIVFELGDFRFLIFFKMKDIEGKT
jgi:hypothetical protein